MEKYGNYLLLNLKNDKKIIVVINDASKINKKVQSIILNDENLTGLWLDHNQIINDCMV